MTTYHLLTLRQLAPVSPGRVARLSRTSGPRWAIVREGDGEYGVAPEELEDGLREAWLRRLPPSASPGERSRE